MKWVHYLKYISSKAYKVLGLIRRAFPSSDLQTKKNLYLLLVRSRLCYGSQIWRPNLLKDITALERVQHLATKFILNDFSSSYEFRLQSLHLLPLMMYFELCDIMYFVQCLKDPCEAGASSVLSHVEFYSGSTCSSANLKLRHSLSKSTAVGHLYFNQLFRLWNSLPPINLNHSIPTIKQHIIRVLWEKFIMNFQSNDSLPPLSPSLRSPDNFSGVPSTHIIPLSFISIFTFLSILCVVKL